MKKLLLILLLCAFAPAFAGMAIAPGTAAHTHSDANTGGGTLAVSGTVSSTKACASGYARLAPNFCGNTAAYATSGLTLDACTALARPASDATALLISASTLLRSLNAVGVKFAQIDAFNDSGCVTMLDQAQWRADENPAETPGSYIGGGSTPLLVRGSTPYIRLSDDTTNQAFGSYAILGYYD